MKDKLIVKQQLEIEDLKAKVKEYKDALSNIDSALFCIGGPLNDNILAFNKEQKRYLQQTIAYELRDINFSED